MSNVWQTAWRITTEILKVKGLTSQLANRPKEHYCVITKTQVIRDYSKSIKGVSF